jgi:uncharacterized repeat protein (TIGR03806 family)
LYAGSVRRIHGPTASTLGVLASLWALSLFAAPVEKITEKPQEIQRREPWTTSRVVGSPDPPALYQVERVFPHLKLEQPVFLTPLPGRSRLLVLQRQGPIVTFEDKPNVEKVDLFLDIKRQLNGLAFHPRFRKNGYVYVYSIDRPERQMNCVRRFTVTEHNPPRCDANSEKTIIEWKSSGHSEGSVEFGPDGYLYVATGDGSSDADQWNSGQDISNLRSTVMRIDVDRADPGMAYGVPADNPFLAVDGARPEIWAFGVRNPWRFSFDRETGNLWLGDVGQDRSESIHLIRRGGNYGWSVMEGNHPFKPKRERGPGPLLPPVVSHPHSEAMSITGGYVYRGTRLKELIGAYIYGDYETGRIWGLRHDGERVTWHKELADTPLKIASFGQGADHELYIVGYAGEFYRLVPDLHDGTPRDEGPRVEFPRRLSETGIFTSVEVHSPSAGVIPYSVNSPLWSDGAFKERFLALPGDSQVDLQEEKAIWRSWNFPEGAVLVKSFSLELERGNPASRRRLETRILTRQAGHWKGYTYIYDDDGRDATLASAGGEDRAYIVHDDATPAGRREQIWHFPSRVQCMVCHTGSANFVLGLSVPQLNRDHDYDGFSANQLQTLDRLGIFSQPLHQPPERLPRLADPIRDTQRSMEERGRSYLHANCAHCHRRSGGGNSNMELAYSLAMAEANLVGMSPEHDTFGVDDVQLLTPGDPARSLISIRMSRLSRGRMPPLSSVLVDHEGLKVVNSWIRSYGAATK